MNLEAVCDADGGEGKALVGLRDAPVGDMLGAHADVDLLARAETQTDADQFAELECAAKAPIGDSRLGQQVHADTGFHIGRDEARGFGGRDAQDRREAKVIQLRGRLPMLMRSPIFGAPLQR